MILSVSFILLYFPIVRAEDATSQMPDFSQLPSDILNETRRILKGREVSHGTRPYMVYLKPVQPIDDPSITSNWLCGGVIIDEYYVLTSAACIENVVQCYVVSGTHTRLEPSEPEDECVKYGKNKAVWKCVLKNYNYDGKEFDNINWINNDIAVIRVEDKFNFDRRVRGCDFIPAPIAYNNKSEDKEKPNTMGSIAGWGSISKFGDPVVGIKAVDSSKLLETDVRVISKQACKQRWPERYHFLIDNMICTQDVVDLNIACADKVNCKEMAAYDQYDDANRRHALKHHVEVHSARDHNLETRRSKFTHIGGFCENDHGGPLIVGQGKTAMVVGVISACQVQDVTRKCHGPFLYTSVYRNRYLISCAIYKEYESDTCRRAMRDGGVMMVRTAFIWPKSGRSGKKSMADIGNPNDDSDLSSSGNTGETQAAAKVDLNTPTQSSTVTAIPLKTTVKSIKSKFVKSLLRDNYYK